MYGVYHQKYIIRGYVKMTRTLKAIQAKAITIEGDDILTNEVTIFVDNFNESTVAKAIRKAEDKHDYKVVKSSAKKVQIVTTMTDEKWLNDSEWSEPTEVTADEE